MTEMQSDLSRRSRRRRRKRSIWDREPRSRMKPRERRSPDRHLELTAMMPPRDSTVQPSGDKNFVKMIGDLISRNLLPSSPAPKPGKREKSSPRNPTPEKPESYVLCPPIYDLKSRQEKYHHVESIQS